MSDEFCVLSFRGPGHTQYGFLDNIEGFEGAFKSSDPYDPADVGSLTATMDRDLPAKLPDYVGNSDGVLVVSARLATFLREHVAAMELFPLRITDHEQKVISDTHQLAHIIHHVDCIDMDKAAPKWSRDKTEIIRMEDRKLPLRFDLIPGDRHLFSPKLLPKLKLVRRELGEKLTAAGFTNVHLDTIEHALASL